MNFLAHQVRRFFVAPEKRSRFDEKFQLRTAADVAEALGNMKGALMKVGQLASYVDEGMPEAFRSALAELQQDAPLMSPELAAGALRLDSTRGGRRALGTGCPRRPPVFPPLVDLRDRS